MFVLNNKIAVVTGAAKGIGAAISKRLVKAGATVYGLDIDAEAGSVLANQKEMSGFRFLQVDVSDEKAVQEVIHQVGQEGNLDILVNNAGVSHIGNLETTTQADMQRLFDINVNSVFHCSKAVIPYMRKAGGGCILNMASIASVVGLADRLAYSMSKGAVFTMTFSIAKDYLKDGIRCNAIGPARIHTPFVDNYLKQNYPGEEAAMFEKLAASQPIGRMGTTEEVAALVHYLCSDEARFITGSFYPIDGGFMRLNS